MQPIKAHHHILLLNFSNMISLISFVYISLFFSNYYDLGFFVRHDFYVMTIFLFVMMLISMTVSNYAAVVF